MHVLLTTDTVGGVWTYTRELVSGLARAGHRVTLVSFGRIPLPAETHWMERLPQVDFRPTAFRLEWMQDSADDVAASGEFLQSVVDEVKPELLHLNQYCYAGLSAAYSGGRKLPTLVVAHSEVVSWWVAVHGTEPPGSPWIKRYREGVAAGLAAADAVVAPSRTMLEGIARHYGRPARTQVIANGRSPLLFNPYVEKEEAVLAAGRLWDEAKNIALLLKATLPLRVRIAGEQNHPDREDDGTLLQPAAKHVKGVEFMGGLREGELRRLYARSAIFVAPSLYEPFGLAVLEAALSRCAIVASDLASFRELWGDSVMYFPAQDAAALRQAIERLQQDRQLRLTYANLAYNRARQAYTAERMTAAYLELYAELIGSGQKSAHMAQAS